MTSSGSAPLFLHIGQGKAGSTTIQSLAKEHREFMTSVGIFCPLTLNGVSNHMRLAWALSNPERDRPTLKKFRRDLAKAQGRKVFLSSEALSSIGKGGLRRLQRFAGDRELRILFYVRDYPSRQPSMYAQIARRALATRNFDDYFRQLTYERISVLPRLEHWAEVFGWQALRVRPLDTNVLIGGDLIGDVLYWLGVETRPLEVPRMNESPHWITVECQRALAASAASAGMGRLDARTRLVSQRLFELCAATSEPGRVQYVTRAQWNQLAEWYRRDVAILGERMGMSFPVELEEPAERPFLPNFDAIPDTVKADIGTLLRRPAFVRQLRPDVVALIERLLQYGESAADAAGSPASSS